jgi:DNA-binding response OmpR family regulator
MAAPLPPHVVVIDDDEDLLAVLRELLEGEGYRVSTLSYPTATPTDLVALAPDLVVLELAFGGEDVGWHYLQRLRRARRTAALPVLVCTAALRLLGEVQWDLTELGVVVVRKPFGVVPFVAEVARLTRGSQAEGPP